MSFYSKMATTGRTLLQKFGSPVTLKRTTGGVTDPVTGLVVSGTDASVSTTGLLRPYPDNVIDGVRIMVSDRELILSDEQPVSPDDRPIIGGEEWSIVSIKTIQPDASTPVIYFAQVRR